MADKTIPLCKDCNNFSNSREKCDRIVRRAFDPLFGDEPIFLHKDARGERGKRSFLESSDERCGPEGRYFEAIEPPAGGSAVYSGSIAPQTDIVALLNAAHTHNVAAAESTIERYSRYAQEMKAIRKDEWEDWT